MDGDLRAKAAAFRRWHELTLDNSRKMLQVPERCILIALCAVAVTYNQFEILTSEIDLSDLQFTYSLAYSVC